MNKQWKIAIAIAIAGIVIISSIIFVLDFFGSSHCPPMKQIAFVNCTYYIYPNRTFAVVNVTEVIPLTDKELRLDDPFLMWVPNQEMDPENITESYYLDNDNNGLLSVGDQYVMVCKKALSVVSLWYMDPPGSGTLWDSQPGPYVWKE